MLSLFLTGGEPTLRTDLPELVSHCAAGAVDVLLSTCGVGVDARLARSLRDAGLDEVQVSIQAMGELHDEIVGKREAFAAAVSGVEAFLQAGMRVTVAAVVTRRNVAALPDLARYAAEVGAHHFRAQRLMPHDSRLLAEIVPRPEFLQLARELAAIARELPEFGIHVHSTPGLTGCLDVFDPRECAVVHPLTHTCSAGKTSMGILSNGDCVPCLELRGEEFLCGNLLQDSLGDVWNAASMKILRNAGPETYTGDCMSCELRWSCYSARCVAYHLTGDLLGDDVSCYLLQDGAEPAGQSSQAP